jgi:hypothetical protein
MMKAAEMRSRKKAPMRSDRTMNGSVFGEGQVRRRPVVVARLRFERPAQMLFVHDEHVIGALSPDRADHRVTSQFCHGDRGAIGRRECPSRRASVNTLGHSRRRDCEACTSVLLSRKRPRRRAIHAAVGFAVALVETSSHQSRCRIANP